MLLTLDVGNTNIKFAVYNANERIAFDMLDSKPIDFRSFFLSFLYKANIRENQIDDAIISCVVPNLFNDIYNAVKGIIGKNPYVIDSDHYYGIDVDPSVQDKVGSDLLVICAYAYQNIKRDLLVVSLGTATVIVHVTADGRCKDFIIAPGFGSMANAIFAKAAQLPDFTPKKHQGFLANNNIDAMNIGVYDGFVGMIRYLISGIKAELMTNPIVVGCGGAGKDVAKYIIDFKSYNPDMVTDGLAFIYNRYIKQ